MHYLLKTEPSEYSFSDLQRDKETTWDGVRNPVALRHLREMPAGAKLVIYHTGEERRAIGTARVLAVNAADPKNPRVKIEAGKALARSVSLAANLPLLCAAGNSLSAPSGRVASWSDVDPPAGLDI